MDREPGRHPGYVLDHPIRWRGRPAGRQPVRRCLGRWRANALAEPGGSRVANQPTGVWLDRISAIEGNDSPTTGSMGLADHLDEAAAQDQANGATPMVVQVVILVQSGFSSGIGMLIDTSRNGWGGPDRPTSASNATDLNHRINESRIDRRIHKGNWCNQSGAGIGERPQASPATVIDAHVWIKPPGESDGSSQFIESDEGKGFDQMCDPTDGGNARNGNSLSGALPNAPVSGHWFSAQFQELMANAYPPLS